MTANRLAEYGRCPHCSADRDGSLRVLSDQLIRLSSAISHQRLLLRLAPGRSDGSPARHAVSLRPDPGKREPLVYRLCRVCGIAGEPDAAGRRAFTASAAGLAITQLRRDLQRETAARLSAARA